MINIRGKLQDIGRPLVMGIVNLTSDSFYAGSRVDRKNLLNHARNMISQGADIIDLGACSTRPGSKPVNEEHETEILSHAVRTLRSGLPETIISIDTFRSSVAEKCIESGADVINDISGGEMDSGMFDTISKFKVPYIAGHMRGTPFDMHHHTDYDDVVAEVLSNLAHKADRLHQKGVCDVIIDPGFGFAKTLDQNYKILASLKIFKNIGCPILAGLSRKSMIYKELGLTPEEALCGTVALNMTALLNGADIIRVHDVRQAVETVKLFEAIKRNTLTPHIIDTRNLQGTRTIEIV